MKWHDWLWFSLIYLLGGQLFSLNYMLAFKTEKRSAWIGLMGLCFPLYLVIDLVVTLASGLGAYSKLVLARFELKEKGK